jgi:hypothetical protein
VLDLCCGTGGIGLCIAKVSNRAHRYIWQIHSKQHLYLCYFVISVLDIFNSSYHLFCMGVKWKYLMPWGGGFQSMRFWKNYVVKLKWL